MPNLFCRKPRLFSTTTTEVATDALTTKSSALFSLKAARLAQMWSAKRPLTRHEWGASRPRSKETTILLARNSLLRSLEKRSRPGALVESSASSVFSKSSTTMAHALWTSKSSQRHAETSKLALVRKTFQFYLPISTRTATDASTSTNSLWRSEET